MLRPRKIAAPGDMRLMEWRSWLVSSSCCFLAQVDHSPSIFNRQKLAKIWRKAARSAPGLRQGGKITAPVPVDHFPQAVRRDDLDLIAPLIQMPCHLHMPGRREPHGQRNEERFLTFTGNEQRDGGKLVPDYRTINRGVSDQDWARHLKGDVSLGLSPLCDAMVKWGAIDVDIYPVIETDEELEALMKAWRDPCLVARSKSGGIHIIAFSREWIPAERMRKYLEAKRDAVLPAEVVEHAQEVFPKQTAGNGSQMNLPAFGGERQVLAWRSPSVVAYVSDDHPVQWDQVESECHVSEGVMADTVLSALTPKPKPKSRRTRERKKSFGGFKRPTDGQAMEGRNSFLYHVGASARARGADNDQIEEIIRSVNDEFADGARQIAHTRSI